MLASTVLEYWSYTVLYTYCMIMMRGPPATTSCDREHNIIFHFSERLFAWKSSTADPDFSFTISLEDIGMKAEEKARSFQACSTHRH